MAKGTGFCKNGSRKAVFAGGRKPIHLPNGWSPMRLSCPDVAASQWTKLGNPSDVGFPLRSKNARSILANRMAELRYRGRSITDAHLISIRDMIAAHPDASRRTLSKKLCELWQWRQANGSLGDMVCRSLLVMLERAGKITLPPVKYVRHNPLANRARPTPVLIDSTPITGALRELGGLEFQQVRRTGDEPLFNSLLEQHHYLCYEQPVGEHLKYLVWGQSRPLACLAWSSAPRHLGARDRYLGWSAEARRRNVRFLAYNTRFFVKSVRTADGWEKGRRSA
jgi:Domain of unknown function (DUF4338)